MDEKKQNSEAMTLTKVLFPLVLGITPLTAGSLNVVHLGPAQDINLEIKSGSSAQSFSLTHESATGTFILPEKPAVLRTIGDKIKALNIGQKKTGRIAVLCSPGDSYQWKIFDSKPTEGKVSLRIINLTDQDTNVTVAGKKIDIKAASDEVIPQVNKGPVRLTLANGEKPKAHEQEEPSAVLGLLYKDKEAWKIFFLNDL